MQIYTRTSPPALPVVTVITRFLPARFDTQKNTRIHTQTRTTTRDVPPPYLHTSNTPTHRFCHQISTLQTKRTKVEKTPATPCIFLHPYYNR